MKDITWFLKTLLEAINIQIDTLLTLGGLGEITAHIDTIESILNRLEQLKSMIGNVPPINIEEEAQNEK